MPALSEDYINNYKILINRPKYTSRQDIKKCHLGDEEENLQIKFQKEFSKCVIYYKMVEKPKLENLKKFSLENDFERDLIDKMGEDRGGLVGKGSFP